MAKHRIQMLKYIIEIKKDKIVVMKIIKYK